MSMSTDLFSQRRIRARAAAEGQAIDPATARSLELWAADDGYDQGSAWRAIDEHEYDWRWLQIRAQQLAAAYVDGSINRVELELRWAAAVRDYELDWGPVAPAA